MISRYKTLEMEKIWNEQSKFERWLKVEISVLSVLCDDEIISKEDFEFISNVPCPSSEDILEEEKKTNHDLASFVKVFSRKIEKLSKYFHKGLTSSDIVDTANALALCESTKVILLSLYKLKKTLKKKSLKYKKTICIGRTHGIHAEPTSFGLKFLGWFEECKRNIKRLLNDLKEVKTGKISGAVGNYSQINIEFEARALKKLSLKPENISTQIIPRDKYTKLISTLALIGTFLERIAIEIRSLQRTEIGEVEERFTINQIGSSAMPHKRNPIVSERICGLSRLLRGYLITSFENIPLWHERDISHSSNERIILEDSFQLAHYMILTMEQIISNLVVNKKRIRKNIFKTKGMVFSQNVLDFLLCHGEERISSYEFVKKCCNCSMRKNKSFKKITKKYIKKLFSQNLSEQFEKDINLIFGFEKYLKNIDKIYERVLN